LKLRLDELLIIRKIADDLPAARALIGAGKVYANDQLVDKAGSLVNEDVVIRLKTSHPYVSRGGLKLQEAINHFQLNIRDKVCIDVGASSGGFTDCLLQNGAAKVYAVDVAYGQLDWKLRQDQRVVVIERFNARNLTTVQIDEYIDLTVIDASFISLTKLIPIVLPFYRKEICLLALIKPQFELPKKMVGKGGIVRDPQHHQHSLDAILTFAEQYQLKSDGIIDSPIRGSKGNKEFLILLRGETTGS
jgi:23S rRNA (cytidine1920-2'-O)/16S rRNA (cytidine1409-2'-O)-methyltransferase